MYQSASIGVADEIVRYICEHRLEVGEPLPTNEELATFFGVSRSVIRDAIKKLESQGVLTARRGSGVYVSQPKLAPGIELMVFRARTDPDMYIQLLETRLVVELGILKYVLERASSTDLQKMDATIAESRRLIERFRSDDSSEIRGLDLTFHQAYFDAAGLKPVSELGEVLRQFFSLHPPRRLTAEVIEQSVSEHQVIVDSIRERNADRLEEVLRKHLERSIFLARAAILSGHDLIASDSHERRGKATQEP